MSLALFYDFSLCKAGDYLTSVITVTSKKNFEVWATGLTLNAFNSILNILKKSRMTRLSILTLVVILATSCQKSTIAPSSGSLASSKHELSIAAKSNFQNLTAHPWLYYKYYLNYVDPSNLGTLVYKRGRSSNALDLDKALATFNTDGTVDEIDENGNYIQGTWQFLDDAQTILQVSNYTGVYTSNIVVLTNNSFNWRYTDINGVERYAEEMSPAKWYTKLVTAHPWMYKKYYTGYIDASNPGTLVYKRGGIHNSIDLDNDITTFYNNGTVDENYNGTHIKGTWSFVDDSYTVFQVVNNTGVYTSTIVQLDNKHFNWHYTDVHGVERYGIQIPAP
jgi:hypothetical protein